MKKRCTACLKLHAGLLRETTGNPGVSSSRVRLSSVKRSTNLLTREISNGANKRPCCALIISEAENREGRPLSSHAFDAGTAWGFLALEATRKGLITHAMGGFDKAKAKKLLGIPDRFVPHAVIAIGYQGSPDQLAPEHREREHPSDRRPLSETLFDGTFGQTLEVRP